MTNLVHDETPILYPCGVLTGVVGFSWSETRLVGVWADKFGAPVGESVVIPDLLDDGRDLTNVGAAWIDF